jgi:uncharacterized Ntn-hydrolase superfamily protein
MEFGTFSIVARSKKTGEFGGATTTAMPCVGAFLPWVEEGVGAIATQAWVNMNLGYQGLELMRSGLGAKTAMEALLSQDPGRDRRQVVAVDRESVFGFTGQECSDVKGHLLGDDFAVAGNILATKSVLDDMASDFRRSKGEFGLRLISALKAGQEAGGDRRGKMSAVLLVASPKPRMYHDIRVDHHTEPLRELRRVYDVCLGMEEVEPTDDERGEILRLKVRRVQK